VSTPGDVRAQQQAEADARVQRRRARIIEADKRLVIARQKLDDDRFVAASIANSLYAMVLLIRSQGPDYADD